MQQYLNVYLKKGTSLKNWPLVKFKKFTGFYYSAEDWINVDALLKKLKEQKDASNIDENVLKNTTTGRFTSLT